MNGFALTVAGLLTGFLVGLTGTGGGALMTPILTLLFGVPPVAAVSTDLVASAVMKPIAAALHARQHTIQWPIVGWLCVGSVPAAFLGALIDGALGSGTGVDQVLRRVMGAALLLAVASMVVRVTMRPRQPSSGGKSRVSGMGLVLVGIAVGVLVGITSVGSGSLVMVTLLLMYPRLTAGRLVGTDLAQALPLVASAALGHLLFGDVQFGLVGHLLLGSIPGALIGATLSTKAPSRAIRAGLAVLLLTSGLTLLGVGTLPTLLVVASTMVAGGLIWLLFAPGHRFGHTGVAALDNPGDSSRPVPSRALRGSHEWR